ncbi:hypothetical protein NQ318_012048 [Aromia moschata]|uniref:ZAD domain-containing protein n=1 Tax=Aromia moschata TaxID=1265417 RepID=A0AAV8XLG2_9CUCU|nr:hypothetical protein NQ318_012048 [Aromia moschata]
MMDIPINEEKPAICKLCFVCCDDFAKINNEIRKKLEFILINQVFLANEDSVCNNCLENLEKCYKFKLYYAKDCVKPLYRGDNDNLDSNICHLNKNEGHNNVNMLRNQPECKLCSRSIEHGNTFQK